jgi:hypothetical protein
MILETREPLKTIYEVAVVLWLLSAVYAAYLSIRFKRFRLTDFFVWVVPFLIVLGIGFYVQNQENKLNHQNSASTL